MAKPRIFVSSTYYDLRHIRSSMHSFISGMGYEPVLFENGDIPFHHDISLAEACYSEVRNSHMLVLIIGGRYGSPDTSRAADSVRATEQEKMYETYNSVTRKEYETARVKDIPIFIFVEKGVKAEYETFKANRKNETIKYVHVDSVNVFQLLDNVLMQRRNNYVKEFDKFEDISTWLREQWAGIYADLLSTKRDETVLQDLTSQIGELSQVAGSLKEYTQSIMRRVLPKQSEEIIDREEAKERSAAIARFRSEPMIRHLRTGAAAVTEHRTFPTAKLFNALRNAASLESFLEQSSLPDEVQRDLLNNFHAEASKDFIDLRRRYFGIEPEEDDNLASSADVDLP